LLPLRAIMRLEAARSSDMKTWQKVAVAGALVAVLVAT
jgi:hypothetical protein